MIYTIQNESLTVRVEDLGAQLSSIQPPDGTEYLWQGDPDIWARRAPILFPFIGRLRENTYCLDGLPYAISTHGFARDMVFSWWTRGRTTSPSSSPTLRRPGRSTPSPSP